MEQECVSKEITPNGNFRKIKKKLNFELFKTIEEIIKLISDCGFLENNDVVEVLICSYY